MNVHTDPVVLDGGDRRCLQLLLELRQLTDSTPPGTTIHITTTDPAAPLDLAAWCHLTGHTYLGQITATEHPRTYAVITNTTPRPTALNNPWRLSSEADLTEA